MIIQTERLGLRQLEQSDFNALSRILQDDEVMYAYNGAFNDEETRQWLDRQLDRYRQYGRFGLWAMVLLESGEMIGQCGLTVQPWKGRELLEIGYLLQKAHWHRGYAIEAARACKEYAFTALDAPEVFSIIRDTNLPSRQVALRNGMTPIDTCIKHYRGVDMPHILYSVKR